jgi:hypothetical protein
MDALRWTIKDMKGGRRDLSEGRTSAIANVTGKELEILQSG